MEVNKIISFNKKYRRRKVGENNENKLIINNITSYIELFVYRFSSI